jgi:hypothetical protein
VLDGLVVMYWGVNIIEEYSMYNHGR